MVPSARELLEAVIIKCKRRWPFDRPIGQRPDHDGRAAPLGGLDGEVTLSGVPLFVGVERDDVRGEDLKRELAEREGLHVQLSGARRIIREDRDEHNQAEDDG